MNTKLKMYLHLVLQILSQAAVMELAPAAIKPWLSLVIGTIGVVVAFKDPSTGFDKAVANLNETGNIKGR